LDKDDKAMFQQVDRPCELIFAVLADTKRELREVERAMFEGAPGPMN
jgi:hypothetical protein